MGGGGGGGGVGGRSKAKNGVRLQTRAITEFMYTRYSFCYNLLFQAKGLFVTNF